VQRETGAEADRARESIAKRDGQTQSAECVERQNGNRDAENSPEIAQRAHDTSIEAFRSSRIVLKASVTICESRETHEGSR
jgi:hypothetical protein